MVQAKAASAAVSMLENHQVQTLRYAHSVILAHQFGAFEFFLPDAPNERLIGRLSERPTLGQCPAKFVGDISLGLFPAAEEGFVVLL